MRECWNNQAIKAVMKIFFILMAMDVAYRVFNFPKVLDQTPAEQSSTPSASVQQQQPMEGISMTNQNGEEVQMKKEYDELYPQDSDDFMGSSPQQGKNASTNHGAVPKMVHIEYCVGCQFNKNFQEVKDELEMRNIATV